MTKDINARLKEFRDMITGNESLSYSEIVELQSLAKYIEPGDVQLLEAAGVPESGCIYDHDHKANPKDCIFQT